MKASRNRLNLALASLVILGAGPSLGQSLAVPCSAFSRNANGGWKVLAPVMLEIDGKLLGPMVGTNLESGTATNGITMSEVLDRECRGVHFDVAARHGMGRAERFQSKPRVRAIVARGEPAHGREAHSDAQATRVTLGDR
jgi:hypothetical protein